MTTKTLQKKLNKQWLLCCYAVSFFSRLPIPASVDFKAHPFHLGNVYLPFIGFLYALVCSVVFYLSHTIFDTTISIIFMLVAGLLVTGAFHEDGFADSCDGFGGGYNKKQCLAIMKDSQIGCYGVIGLILLFALKITVLSQLAAQDLWVFIGVIFSAAIASRFSALCLIQTSEYARLDETSKASASSQTLPITYFVAAGLFSLASLLWMSLLTGHFFSGILIILTIILFISVSTFLCKKYFEQKIQGYTGDCLGFLQQFNELLILLISLAFLN